MLILQCYKAEYYNNYLIVDVILSIPSAITNQVQVKLACLGC